MPDLMRWSKVLELLAHCSFNALPLPRYLEVCLEPSMKARRNSSHFLHLVNNSSHLASRSIAEIQPALNLQIARLISLYSDGLRHCRVLLLFWQLVAYCPQWPRITSRLPDLFVAKRAGIEQSKWRKRSVVWPILIDFPVYCAS